MSSVPARMYFPFGENFTNDTGGFSSSGGRGREGKREGRGGGREKEKERKREREGEGKREGRGGGREKERMREREREKREVAIIWCREGLMTTMYQSTYIQCSAQILYAKEVKVHTGSSNAATLYS